MSKKKNTLKDLDAFLKQQAATLVSPDKLQPIEDVRSGEQVLDEPEILPKKAQTIDTLASQFIGLASEKKAEKYIVLCDLILKSMESQRDTSPEEKMLINTALYLKNPEDWKEVIREYWRKKA